MRDLLKAYVQGGSHDLLSCIKCLSAGGIGLAILISKACFSPPSTFLSDSLYRLLSSLFSVSVIFSLSLICSLPLILAFLVSDIHSTTHSLTNLVLIDQLFAIMFLFFKICLTYPAFPPTVPCGLMGKNLIYWPNSKMIKLG